MNGNPTKAQQDWHEWLISYGCSVQIGMNEGNLSIHHIGGSKLNVKGVKKPGEWYCICLCYWWHQDGRNPAARHINKKQFEREAGKTEKQMFIDAVEIYESIYGRKPMSEWDFQQIIQRA